MCFSSISVFFRSAYRISVGVVVCMGIASCSFIAPSRQTVTIRSTDPDAILRVDGEYVGQGVATPKLTKNHDHRIEAEKDGLRGSTIVSSSLSFYAMMDIVCGVVFILPLFGLMAPGAWKLDRDEVTLDPH